MTPQEALIEARNRYPKGTVYKSWAGYIYTVEDPSKFEISPSEAIWAESGKGTLYDPKTDTWAEIISTPKTLEERLVDEFGFKKETLEHNNSTTNRYTKDSLDIDFDYVSNVLLHINISVGDPEKINQNNLEDFIKSFIAL